MEKIDLYKNIYLKITRYTSLPKCISILRRYTNKGMSEIQKAIEANDFVFYCEHTSDEGVVELAKCYDELSSNGATVEIYELGIVTTREIIGNLINTHAEIAQEVEADMNAEASDCE